MGPLPEAITQLAKEFKFPKPDNPDDPNSGFSLTNGQGRLFGALLGSLVDYILVEHARCGKTATP